MNLSAWAPVYRRVRSDPDGGEAMRHPETRGGDETKDAGRDPGHLARAARRLGMLGALAILPLVAVAGPGVGAAMAAEPEIPPIVVIKPAVAVPGGFEMKATIYTYSLDTHYHFEYGTTTTYGTNLPVPDGDAGTAPEVQVSQVVTGVQPNTTYHFRLTATNSERARLQRRRKIHDSGRPQRSSPARPGTAADERWRLLEVGSAEARQVQGSLDPDHVERPHPLQPQRGEEREVHLHEGKRLSGALAPADGSQERHCEGSRDAGHHQAARWWVPSHLPRASALHLRRGRQTRPGGRSGPEGRRHLARGDGPEAEALAPPGASAP